MNRRPIVRFRSDGIELKRLATLALLGAAVVAAAAAPFPRPGGTLLSLLTRDRAVTGVRAVVLPVSSVLEALLKGCHRTQMFGATKRDRRQSDQTLSSRK